MDVESQGLEFKARVENFREVGKTVCAFANAFGGKIVVGVSDKGRVVGVPDGDVDLLQQRLEGTVQLVSPVPPRKIFVEEKNGLKTVVLEVYPIDQSSFCTFNGITYYRAGSVDAKLEGRTLQDFMVKRRILCFDDLPSAAKIGDIDAAKLREFLKTRSPEIEFQEGKVEEYLLNLGLAQGNGELRIKNAAVLFFAKDSGKFIPQSEVKLARFAGTKAVEIIDSRFVTSTILENLREAEDFIKKNTRTAFKMGKLQREEVPEYPPKATREALVNALTHRDYFSRDSVQINIFDDRIEFINPGGLPAGLTRQLLGTLSIQRNPVTYRLMRDQKLVEGMATGVPRMREAMNEARLPAPDFKELGSFFRVTLYNSRRMDAAQLNERQKQALAYLEKNPSITSKTYEKLTSISHPSAVADLNDLIEKEYITRIGKRRGTYYVKII